MGGPMDRAEFRKRLALRLAVSPGTVLPFVGGVSALIAAWTFDLSSIVSFGGIVAMLVGIGVLATRVSIHGATIARDLDAELRQQAEWSAEQTLDQLRRRLQADHDPRDEELLDALRDLVGVFRKEAHWVERVNAVSAQEIREKVEELFRMCVRKLEAEFSLSATAQTLRVAEAKNSLLAQRERLIGEVQESVKVLTTLIAGVYQLGTRGNVDEETARIREELQRSLEVARRVEEELEGSNPAALVRARMKERAERAREKE
ncbi:MAG: hypothetical protein V1723_02450 [Candidatus Uhrbacteria bacterium]